ANFDWQTLISNKNVEIARLNQVYHKLLIDAGVTLLQGHAEIVNPHCVKVGEEIYTTRHILIATGGEPIVPDFPGSEHVITSDEAFFLESLDRKSTRLNSSHVKISYAVFCLTNNTMPT